MAKGGNKGNGGEGVGKSVFLFKIDEDAGTAEVVRMPFDTEDPNGAVLVRTSEDVIRGITDATLSQYPEQVRRALAGLVKQSIRSKVRGAEAFVTTEVVLELPDTDTKGKGKKAKVPNGDDGPDEDDSEDESGDDLPGESVPVTDEPQPQF